MVTDSWAHARAMLGRFLSPGGSRDAPLAVLDDARSRLITAEGTEEARIARDVTVRCRSHLHHLVEAGLLGPDDLRALLASLHRLPGASPTREAVHNTISGGSQHGPTIQAGRIAGLTFHAPEQPRER
ncbi:hypothetical protein ACR9VJ_08875 [Streptomyces sp. H49]|uniref:hypothetical protein n=1 Tax=Streptomyces sp. H49 TaxID=3444117 RepID=UPI003F4AF76C